MIKNYLKIALRTIIRSKGFSILNISGLAIGMVSFILISLWIFYHLQFDQFHVNKDRIFRVNTITKEHGIVTSSSWRLGSALKESYPEIETYTRLWPWSRSLVTYQDKVFDESFFFLADPDFFTMFSFPFVYGNPETALRDKYAIVLTETAARRYFGEENPIGKSMFVRLYEHDFTVTGVIYDIPVNSSIRFELMARVDLMPKQRMESWEFTGYTCIMIKENTDHETVNKKIKNFYREYVNADAEITPVLQPLTAVHLYEEGVPGLIKQIYLFSIIAIFILLIACINFVNLSTARAAKRMKEVGIRKVVGAFRKQLVNQFLGESLIITVLSLFVAIILVEIILPFFNEIAYTNITLFTSRMYKPLLLIIGSTIITGILAGCYPALYLSSFHPSKILKGGGFPGGRNNTFRQLLTIFQFAISIGLIMSTFIVQKQIYFIQHKDLGLKRDLIIGISNNPDLNNRFEAYRNELVNSGYVDYVTATATNPLDVGQFIGVNWEGHFDQEQVEMPYTMVDYDFFKTYDMRILQGRAFSREFPNDSTEACIINETAANLMGLKCPVGAEVYFNHPAFEESFKKVKIIGVVNDFHHRSLHGSIMPFIFRMYKPWNFLVNVKLKPGNIQQALLHIETVTKKYAPQYPFRFEFLNDSYNRIYTRELIMGKIFNVFSALAIFISCLGLFGLASFTVEQRTKEIGIRKVLGASITGIVTMLSSEFTRWVLLANIIAWPIAWYAMNKWLNNFVYRVQINWWLFILAALLAFVIALLTISYQTVRAALSNPIDSLRYE